MPRLRTLILIASLLLLSLSLIDRGQGEHIVVMPLPLGDRYLSNPGMGWQNNDTHADSLFPETVAYADISSFRWRTLNPAAGVYIWDALDERIQQANRIGKQFSFRVITMGTQADGQQMPRWVLDQGAILTADGTPDYANCTYQQTWGNFIDALRTRYDGHPAVAFIDISGYGHNDDWDWIDGQTEWDYEWEDNYNDGTADGYTLSTLDGHARHRLADTFIGGSTQEHLCRDQHGQTQRTAYRYAGFQHTQMVMPYAGIRQSIQYVVTRHAAVGLRYDCLGQTRSDQALLNRLAVELGAIWRQAPVVLGFCPIESDDALRLARDVARQAHASLIHDTLTPAWRDAARMETLSYDSGYRFVLDEIRYPTTLTSGQGFTVTMRWRNIGLAPLYPRMGAAPELHLALSDSANRILHVYALPAEISAWMPAESGDPHSAPMQSLRYTLTAPELASGSYQLQVAIVDKRSGNTLQLAIAGRTANGYYALGSIRWQAR